MTIKVFIHPDLGEPALSPMRRATQLAEIRADLNRRGPIPPTAPPCPVCGALTGEPCSASCETNR